MAGLQLSPDQIAKARQSGYSDEDIASYLAQKSPDQFKSAFDAGYTPTQVLDHLGGSATPSTDAPVSATGLAKAAGTGLLEGAASVPGIVGDADNLVRSLTSKAFTPEQQATIDASRSPIGLPTTSSITSILDKLGLIHKSQNSAERSTENVASFAGAGAIGGPEAAAKALVPGLVSEGAGKLTEGTALEPYARIAGALLTPTPGRYTPKVNGAVPEAADLTASGGQGLNTVRATNSAVEPSVMAGWATRNLSDLNARNIGQRADQVSNLLSDVAANRAPLNGQDLDLLKLKLNDIKQSGSVADRQAAVIALGNLDDRLNSLTGASMRFGNPEDITAPWMQGKGDYAAGMRGEYVDSLIANGKTAAAGNNSGMNVGNTVRQQFKPMLKVQPNGKPSKYAQGFSADEMAQAARVENGTKLGNMMRYGSNVLGGGGGIMGLLIPSAIASMVGAGTGSFEDSGIAGAGAGLAGLLLRKGANASVLRQANALSEMVRARSPMAQAAGVTISPATTSLTRAQRLLLAHDALMRSTGNQ